MLHAKKNAHHKPQNRIDRKKQDFSERFPSFERALQPLSLIPCLFALCPHLGPNLLWSSSFHAFGACNIFFLVNST